MPPKKRTVEEGEKIQEQYDSQIHYRIEVLLKKHQVITPYNTGLTFQNLIERYVLPQIKPQSGTIYDMVIALESSNSSYIYPGLNFPLSNKITSINDIQEKTKSQDKHGLLRFHTMKVNETEEKSELLKYGNLLELNNLYEYYYQLNTNNIWNEVFLNLHGGKCPYSNLTIGTTIEKDKINFPEFNTFNKNPIFIIILHKDQNNNIRIAFVELYYFQTWFFDNLNRNMTDKFNINISINFGEKLYNITYFKEIISEQPEYNIKFFDKKCPILINNTYEMSFYFQNIELLQKTMYNKRAAVSSDTLDITDEIRDLMYTYEILQVAVTKSLNLQFHEFNIFFTNYYWNKNDLNYKFEEASLKISYPTLSNRVVNILETKDLNNNAVISLPLHLFKIEFKDGDKKYTYRNIQGLRMNNALLLKIPLYIKYFNGLIELNLGHNQISSIHKALGEMLNLQILILSHNRISKIPDLSKLSKLKFLSINNNLLENIPVSIYELKNLEQLNISDNNIMEELKKDNISKLLNLKDFYFENTNITAEIAVYSHFNESKKIKNLLGSNDFENNDIYKVLNLSKLKSKLILVGTDYQRNLENIIVATSKIVFF